MNTNSQIKHETLHESLCCGVMHGCAQVQVSKNYLHVDSGPRAAVNLIFVPRLGIQYIFEICCAGPLQDVRQPLQRESGGGRGRAGPVPPGGRGGYQGGGRAVYQRDLPGGGRGVSRAPPPAGLEKAPPSGFRDQGPSTPSQVHLVIYHLGSLGIW